ncbi:MAG TPA: DUF2917 domain-containing protein [Burkholderiales bacterium]|nr:DUF2917 domain-containing protein [Burkholderiales bacterium]
MSPSKSVDLQRDAALTLRNAKGTRVCCLAGAVWITQDDNRRDIVLEPGGVCELSCSGATVVLALQPARIGVQAPQSRRLGLRRVYSSLRAAYRG